MKALILAAGVGTRLQPLTLEIPKALIPVCGYPMLEIIIQRLIGAGFKEVIINLHHKSDQIKEFIESKNQFGIRIEYSDESERLLDTGGAIKKASGLLSGKEDLLVHNVDILTNLDYNSLIQYHKAQDARATLAVKDRTTSRPLLVDARGILRGWENPEKRIRIVTTESTRGLRQTAFSGVYVLSPAIFADFPAEEVFGFMPWILDIAGSGGIQTWDQESAFWFEAGRLESLEQTSAKLVAGPSIPGFLALK